MLSQLKLRNFDKYLKWKTQTLYLYTLYCKQTTSDVLSVFCEHHYYNYNYYYFHIFSYLEKVIYAFVPMWKTAAVFFPEINQKPISYLRLFQKTHVSHKLTEMTEFNKCNFCICYLWGSEVTQVFPIQPESKQSVRSSLKQYCRRFTHVSWHAASDPLTTETKLLPSAAWGFQTPLLRSSCQQNQ